MAHTILGLDLGAYSVKVAVLAAGFRQAKLIGVHEKRLLESLPDESAHERAARTVKALLDEENLHAEMYATTMSGEAVLRLVSFPVPDRKRIEQSLSFELESQVLDDVTDMVLDFVITRSEPGNTQVLAVGAPKEEVQARIAALAAIGCEPRVIGCAALSYVALARLPLAQPLQPGPHIVVDLGHRHTQVCLVDGESVLYARSIARGGEEVTLALAEAFRMTPEAAEDAKHRQAFVAAPGEQPESPAHARVDRVVRDALRPLVRELKQTLAAYRSEGGVAPVQLVVTGGAARLRGLPDHLAHELGLPVAQLSIVPSADDPMVDPALRDRPDDPLGAALPAQALGLALAAAAPVPQVNLRKGDLAYRTDYSYLRGKARAVGIAAVAILLFAGFNALASLRALHKEGDALEAQLGTATRELFGEPRLDGKAVSEELSGGPKGGAPPIPTASAFDVLDEISRHVPAPDKGRLDILELDIKPKKTYLKATSESQQQIDELVKELEKIECFGAIEKGKVSTVTAPPSGDNPKGEKASELRQFTLTITTTCP